MLRHLFCLTITQSSKDYVLGTANKQKQKQGNSKKKKSLKIGSSSN